MTIYTLLENPCFGGEEEKDMYVVLPPRKHTPKKG